MSIRQYSTKERVMNHEYFEKDFMSTALSLLQYHASDKAHVTELINKNEQETHPCIDYEEDEKDEINDYNNFVQDFVAVFKTELEERES